MANFPQSFEPVNSNSILEQFLQLKGNVNKVNTAMVDVEQTADSAFEKSSNNETSIQVLENDVQTLSTGLETAEQNLSKCVRFDVQSLTDEQKAQARSNIGAGSAMATTVLVNGVAQTQIQFDSDPQTQISALDSRLDSAENDIITNAGAISALDGKALKTPMTAPAENEIPTINTENSQVNVTVGDGLKIENNELKVDKTVIYPVGSIYMSTENTSPASMFGGTWEQIKDKFLLSAGDAYSAGSTGGEASHMITQTEMARINLPFSTEAGSSPNKSMLNSNSVWTYGKTPIFLDFERNGAQTPLSLMPPYLVVYCWKRIS